jgi:uncharacterized protein (DUF58 family)
LRVIREILFFEPKGRQTNVRGALEHLLRTQKRKAVVFLISDFLEGGELPTLDRAGGKDFFRLLAIANKRHDVICVAMRDAREEALPDVGIISLEDSETGEVVEVNTGSRALRERYAKESARRLKAFKQGCAQSRADVMEICNRSQEVAEVPQEASGGKRLSVKEMDYMQALRGFLRRRQRSRRRV